jgi:glycosyltransferase involved in cell wall biosynthesis
MVSADRDILPQATAAEQDKSMKAPVPISLVVLTKDEEHNIKECLASAVGFDDVHVLDSGSADRTMELARSAGAVIHCNPFSGFGQQRNWAIDNIKARYEWQMHLDADERLTPELIAEMTAVLATSPREGGYLIPSKLLFAGRWLKHAGQYPGYQVRLFHRRRLRFADHGHGQREVTESPIGRLRQPLLHHAFSRGVDHWFAKHAVYARREAELALGLGQDGGAPEGASLFSRDGVRRRRALKRLTARLPGRYFLRLLYMLLFRGAFLDGQPGIIYAHMLATYEAMIDVHLRLLRHGLKP